MKIVMALSALLALHMTSTAEISPEGTTAGFDPQMEKLMDLARTRVSDAFDSRLENILMATETDECRRKLLNSFERNMKAEILEHGPWERSRSLLPKHRFTNECKVKRTLKKPEIPSDP